MSSEEPMDNAELRLFLEGLLIQMKELKAENKELKDKLIEIAELNNDISRDTQAELSLSRIDNRTKVFNPRVMGSTTDLEREGNTSPRIRAKLDNAVDYLFEYCEKRDGPGDFRPREGWRDRKPIRD